MVAVVQSGNSRHNSRLKVLKDEIKKSYFISLKKSLWEEGVKGPDDDVKGLKVYPPRELATLISYNFEQLTLTAAIKPGTSIPGRTRRWARSRLLSSAKIPITVPIKHMVSHHHIIEVDTD